MVKNLPARFKPDLMERAGTRYEATLPLARFERLAAVLASVEGELRVTARFSRRKDHIVVGGRLRADYVLECQRCLGPMTHAVDAPYELVFVDDEAAAERLPKALDPVVLDENGQIRAVDLFEDELLLHLPIVPRHDDPERCPVAVHSFGEAAEDAGDDARRRPFDVLKDLDLH